MKTDSPTYESLQSVDCIVSAADASKSPRWLSGAATHRARVINDGGNCAVHTVGGMLRGHQAESRLDGFAPPNISVPF